MSDTAQFSRRSSSEPIKAPASSGDAAGRVDGSGGTKHSALAMVSDHELLALIGQGSYGEVWLARTILGELRAIKIIHRTRFNNQRPFEREFEGIQHFEKISRSHPSQLAILHVGKNEAAGYFYYVMELADAVKDEATSTNYVPHTLRQDLDEHGRLPIPQCVDIGLSLATALAHLHQHRLVHRDIKPSNVIFVKGAPKLGDIGLVTEAGDTQSIVGTEGYIPPEGPGTPPADLFSLGKVLYEISTGLDRRRFPELPEDLNAWPDCRAVAEFNEVVLKACARNQTARYQTAGEMGADLELLKRGQSVKELNSRRQIRRAAQRTGRVFALLSALIGAIATVVHWFPRSSTYEGQASGVVEANNLFDIGYHAYQNRREAEVQKAIVQFEKAVQLDPNFAKAYSWLAAAQCWYCAGTNATWELVPFARKTAHRALSLDSSLPKAHLALAWCALVENWDWVEAERGFNRALTFDSQDPEIYEWRGFARGYWGGRTEEGIADLNRATKLRRGDDLLGKHFLTFVLEAARRYDEAINLGRTVTRMEPDGALFAYSQLAECLVRARRFPEGIEMERQAALHHERGTDLSRANDRADALLHAYQIQGEPGYWQELLNWTEHEGANPYRFASLHARLGHADEALSLLEKAEHEHDIGLFQNIKTDPALDTLRQQPRFRVLLRRMKLDR